MSIGKKWVPFDAVPQTRKAEQIAQAFHEAYERLAPDFGYETRPESATAWEKVPAPNRALMIAVVQELLDQGVVK